MANDFTRITRFVENRELFVGPTGGRGHRACTLKMVEATELLGGRGELLDQGVDHKSERFNFVGE